MRPPSPLPAINSTDGTYCPIPAGPFAFSATIPWGRNRELTTLSTRLRAVDPFGKSLVCIDVLTTPLAPLPHSPYGRANIVFWATVALAAAYWIVGSAARVASAWNRGIIRSGGAGWARARSAGYVLASAISGERLAAAPALMRFCEPQLFLDTKRILRSGIGTPAVRDVIFHTQWCAVLAMVAVEWPQFVCASRIFYFYSRPYSSVLCASRPHTDANSLGYSDLQYLADTVFARQSCFAAVGLAICAIVKLLRPACGSDITVVH